jgi:hypothetical protein
VPPPPAVSPEGDMVFRGKPSRPLILFIRWDLHSYNQLGCWCVNNEKSLEVLSKGRSDVAVGCFKRW